MKFKIISTFTVFNADQMTVCNAGDTVELDEALAEQFVAAGMAEAVKAGRKPKAEEPATEPAADTAATEEAPIA
jgi:hypothetical protein